MGITSTISDDGETLTIRISGRFEFSSHRDFRVAYSQVEPSKADYILDMRDAEYMDSAALGMLLVLRERAGGNAAKITLKGCRPEVQQILDISRFNQMFTIET